MTDTETGQINAAAAEVYEEFFVPALFGQWPERLLDVAAVEPGQRVLDVGCGTGVLARSAVERVGPRGRVVGIDPNQGMLEVARRASTTVEWRAGVAETLPFEDGSFDRVLSQFALMFFTDQTAALDELARVLAPGGRLAVATWAAVSESPGYAAMVDLLRRLLGDAAADALLAPFSLGRTQQVQDLVGSVFSNVTVTRHDGVARFESIEAWVHTDIRGWTLADMIDDDQYARLLAEATTGLDRFVGLDGRVEFAAPALVVTGAVG